jgi:transcriptional regulator with XRE-family HTH domain
MSKPITGLEESLVTGPADLGAAIRVARLALGLTPEQAAERCGVSTENLLELEHGAGDVYLVDAFRVINHIGLEAVTQPIGKAMLTRILMGAGDPVEVASALEEYYGAERPWLFP